MRWFNALPTHRKVCLFLTGGMLTLVFDAFVSHLSWTRATMRWNQWIPVIYGLAAFLALAVVTLKQLLARTETRVLMVTGVLGILVGSLGMFFHGLELVDSLDGEEKTLMNIGKIIATSPPTFAPAAFAGVGLLLVTLKRITGAPRAEARA